MNYYERHIGDYLKDTAHLSLLEHGVYSRLMDVYYTKETGIPAGDVARLIGARSREEKQALQVVLKEFFVLDADAYRQSRCDREISHFKDKQDKAKRSANARWKPDAAQSEGNADAMRTHMRTHSDGNAPRHQTPDTSPQTPDPNTEDRHSSAPPSQAAKVCLVIKAEGIGSVNPAHPKLLALLAEGAEVEQFIAAAKVAVNAGKGFAYLLGVVKGMREDAQRQPTRTMPENLSFAERDRIAGMQRWEVMCNRKHPDLPDEFSMFPATAGVIENQPHAQAETVSETP